MSLRERIPEQLKLSDSLISITLEDDVGVFDTGDYVLIEVSHKVGRIDVFKIAKTVLNLVRKDRKMVAVRGYGFKGIGMGVRIAHEIKMMEDRFRYEMTFDTFDATESGSEQTQTSVQIIIIPPE